MTQVGMLLDDYYIEQEEPSVKAWTAAYALTYGSSLVKFLPYNSPLYNTGVYPAIWENSSDFDTSLLLGTAPDWTRYFWAPSLGGWQLTKYGQGWLRAHFGSYLPVTGAIAPAPSFRHLDIRLRGRVSSANTLDYFVNRDGGNRPDLNGLADEPLQSIRISHFGRSGKLSLVAGDELQICNSDLFTIFSSTGSATTDMGQSVISATAIGAHATIYRNQTATVSGYGTSYALNSLELNTNLRFFAGYTPLSIGMISDIMLSTMGVTTDTFWDDRYDENPNQQWAAFKAALDTDLDLFSNEITADMDASGKWTVPTDQDVSWIISVAGWGQENTHDISVVGGWYDRTTQPSWDLVHSTGEITSDISVRIQDTSVSNGNLNFYEANWPSAFLTT